MSRQSSALPGLAPGELEMQKRIRQRAKRYALPTACQFLKMITESERGFMRKRPHLYYRNGMLA